jgi:hypothetical protein
MSRSLSHVSHLVIACNVAALVACGPAPAAAPDARPDASSIPTSVEGTFAVTSQLGFTTVPAQALLDQLAAATDDPDDPGRFLVDRLVAAIPDGPWHALAVGLAPYVAPYVQAELAHVAPKLASGLRALAQNLGTVAHHATTTETWRIARDGTTTRAITAVQLGTTGSAIVLAEVGLPDGSAVTRIALDRDQLAIAGHRVALPYGKLLRLALDRTVVPGIDLSASNLADLFRDLVDCHGLGALFAAKAGIGWPGLYETACSAAMTQISTEVYDDLAAIDARPFELVLTGSATAIDVDGNGSTDALAAGTWTGSTIYGASAQLGASSFAGTVVR